MAELSLVWDGPHPIGQTNLSQPEYQILQLVAREQVTHYNQRVNSRKLGQSRLICYTVTPYHGTNSCDTNMT